MRLTFRPLPAADLRLDGTLRKHAKVLHPGAVVTLTTPAGPLRFRLAYKSAVRKAHPDAGGTAAGFQRVQDAWEFLKQGGYV